MKVNSASCWFILYGSESLCINNYVFGPASQITLCMTRKFLVLWWWPHPVARKCRSSE